MHVDPRSGRLQQARWIPSPNADERPPEAVIDTVIIHGISLPPGEFGGPWIEHLFTNRLDPAAHAYFAEVAPMRVSSHLLIRRQGELEQYVSFARRAWHAGASCFDGRERCNDFSIGIELEGTDDQPYEPEQYRCLGEVLRALMQTYPAITLDRIVGHCDVAPGRKTDPGPVFDWHGLRKMLASGQTG